MDIIEATKYTYNGVLMVSSSYKIVEKEETKVLIKILEECKTIRDAYEVMSFPLQEDIVDEGTIVRIMNQQIDKKLKRLYRYYSRHHHIKFDDGNWGKDNSEFSAEYRRKKSTENNIALICETIRSWE